MKFEDLRKNFGSESSMYLINSLVNETNLKLLHLLDFVLSKVLSLPRGGRLC